jgi:hypothetical protein
VNRLLLITTLLITLNGCSRTSPTGLPFIRPIEQDGNYFKGAGSKIPIRFDSLFNIKPRTSEFEVYRMTTSIGHTEDVFLVYSDKVVSYNQDSDGKEYYVMRKIYDASFRKKIIAVMDSIFWTVPVNDNTSSVHDGAILQIEGLRGERYEKILRKVWSDDKRMRLLEDVFRWY